MKNKFTLKQKQELKKLGYRVFTLTGKSLNDLAKDNQFWSTWFKEYDFANLKSRKGEVAINPDKLFLPDSNNKTLSEQEAIVKAAHSPVEGVDLIIGEVSDYAELAFMHFKKTGERLFGEKYDYKYTRTKTKTSGSGVADVGCFHRGDGLDVAYWVAGVGYGSLRVAPLAVPGIGNRKIGSSEKLEIETSEKDVVVESDADKDQIIKKIKDLKENSRNAYSLKRNDVELFWKGFDAAINEVISLWEED